MWGVTLQNEPASRPFNYEACCYTAEQHRDFAKNHWGPTLRKAYPSLVLMGELLLLLVVVVRFIVLASDLN